MTPDGDQVRPTDAIHRTGLSRRAAHRCGRVTHPCPRRPGFGAEALLHGSLLIETNAMVARRSFAEFAVRVGTTCSRSQPLPRRYRAPLPQATAPTGAGEGSSLPPAPAAPSHADQPKRCLLPSPALRDGPLAVSVLFHKLLAGCSAFLFPSALPGMTTPRRRGGTGGAAAVTGSGSAAGIGRETGTGRGTARGTGIETVRGTEIGTGAGTATGATATGSATVVTAATGTATTAGATSAAGPPVPGNCRAMFIATTATLPFAALVTATALPSRACPGAHLNHCPHTHP